MPASNPSSKRPRPGHVAKGILASRLSNCSSSCRVTCGCLKTLITHGIDGSCTAKIYRYVGQISAAISTGDRGGHDRDETWDQKAYELRAPSNFLSVYPRS